jgi:hypothetical protein
MREHLVANPDGFNRSIAAAGEHERPGRKAIRREPHEPDLSAGARDDGVDVPHVLGVVLRVRMVRGVERDRFFVVIDRDVRSAAERPLNAERGATPAGEAVDDDLVRRETHLELVVVPWCHAVFRPL